MGWSSLLCTGEDRNGWQRPLGIPGVKDRVAAGGGEDCDRTVFWAVTQSRLLHKLARVEAFALADEHPAHGLSRSTASLCDGQQFVLTGVGLSG